MAMAGKDLFTDEEWALVAPLPGLVIMASSISDGKALPSVREVAAGGEVLADAAKAHPDNALVTALVNGMKDAKPDLGEEKPTSSEAVVEVLATQIETAWTTLSSKASSEDLAVVRDLLLAAARAVVERLGTGFMGSGDEKVSPSEQAFLDRLTGILAG